MFLFFMNSYLLEIKDQTKLGTEQITFLCTRYKTTKGILQVNEYSPRYSTEICLTLYETLHQTQILLLNE